MTLHAVYALDKVLGTGHIAQTPTGHGVGFAESVHGDRAREDLLREAADAHVRGAVIQDLLVDLVGDDVELLVAQDDLGQATYGYYQQSGQTSKNQQPA